MNDTNFFLQQSLDFQFLSVCHYVNTLGIIFYNKDLITFEERNQTIPVINALFDYVNKSKNESEAKLQILKNALRGTDLYGGGDNETLDMRYVEETYQYIINKVLFAHYGNINGYLAKIINQADNINYFSLKENVLYNLRENYNARDYCSVSNENTKLTPLTIRKVFEDHIWSTFPQPEHDMSIIDVNYIYAMVGLKIVKSVTTDVNLTFQEYILISREIDLQQFNNETYQMVLKMFSAPALYFYAIKMKEKFRNMDQLNDKFWSEAYENLFLHISTSVNEIITQGIESSLHFKLDKEMKNLKSRTLVAYERLQLYCQYKNIAQVSEMHVAVYKTLFHWITKLLLPDRCRTSELPELEQVYEDQFAEVEKIYKQIETNAVENALENGQLVEKMNPNATVFFAQVPNYSQHCHLCPPMPRKKNNDIYLLFAIKQETETDYFAFRQENNSLTLLSSRGNEPEFGKAVANDSFLRMEILEFSQTLKFRGKDYKMFVERVAEMKTKQFIKAIKRYYYDETLGEKYLNFVKSLIPFYNCVESVQFRNVAGAALSCTIDVVSLIPLAGFSAKYTTQLGSKLVREIGNRYLITNTLARGGIVSNLPITTVLQEITGTAVRTVANEILTRGFLKDFAVATFRSVDPGFEPFYQIINFGFKTFRRLFGRIIVKFRRIPKSAKAMSPFKSIFRNLRKYVIRTSDETGLVPLVLSKQNGYSIVRYLYPGGLNPFGPTCITSYGKTAELRSIEGYAFEIPVIPVKSGGVTFYKQYIPESGKMSDIKLQMGGNDILQRVGYLLDKMFVDGHDKNLFRSYDVYHNEIFWNKPLGAKATENINSVVEGPNTLSNPTQHMDPQFSRNAETVLGNNFPANVDFLQSSDQFQDSSGGRRNYNPQVSNPEVGISLTDNLGPSSSQMTNIQFSEILPDNIVDHVLQPLEPELPGPSEGFEETNYDISKGVSEEVLQTLRNFLESRQNVNHAPKSIAEQNVVQFPESNHPETLIENANTDPNSSNQNSFLKELLSSGERPPLIAKSLPNQNVNYNLAQISNPESLPTEKVTNDEKKSTKEKKPSQERGYLAAKKYNPSLLKTVDDVIEEHKTLQTQMTQKVPPLHGPDAFLQYVPEIQDFDNIPGTSKQFITHSNSKLYKAVIKEPMYSKYVQMLLILKNYGLPFLKQDKVKINFLRTALNKLALFQLDVMVPLEKPKILWCTEIITTQKQIDFRVNLKGTVFFFNDITMLTSKLPGSLLKQRMDPSVTEVRYRLMHDSPYGLVDLTKFNNEFRDNYVTFNDMFYLVTDIYFIANKNILIVELKSQGVSRRISQHNREQDISNLLLDGRSSGSLRMRSITKAADFMADNAILCTFQSSRDFLKTYILSRKWSWTDSMPTYDMFAEDIKTQEFRYSYDHWRIMPHEHIEDVLLKSNLDQISELSEAERRIEEVYGLVYIQNIQEAFNDYLRTFGISERIRFEDYYVLYSRAKNAFLMSTDGVRRYQAAINRLSLRQCDEEWIGDSIVLYNGEMISEEISAIIQLFENGRTVVFTEIKMFSLQRLKEQAKLLNQRGTCCRQVPLMMEITLSNQAGVADVGRIVNDNNVFHVVTTGFQFILDDVHWQIIQGRSVLVMKMHDFRSPTESRMVQMAKNLHQLFSTNTMFYSDS